MPRGLVGGPFGSALGGKDYVPSGVPVIRGSNLASAGFFDASEFAFVTAEKALSLGGNLARPGDVVFTQRGTLGQVGIIPDGPFDTYVVSQSQMRLRVDPAKAVARFVYYQFRTPALVDAIRNSAITTGVPHINLGILGALPIVIPPLEAQEAIASVLSAIDEKITANSRSAVTAFDLAAAEFARAAVSSSRPVPLGEVLDLAYGKALPAGRRRPGPVPVYGSGGVSGTHDRALVGGPGVIVGRKGTAGSVHWSPGDFYPIDTTYYVRLKNRMLSLPYVYFLLRGLGLSEMNSDSAVPGLNRSRALAVPVRLPAASAIAEFTARVRPLFALRDQLASENDALSGLRDYLLPRLIAGEIEVR
ncbi:restriction endonuclease subunit S [Actinoplanes sp. CA-030573]|uniref:restriction endonuclease subunit S n=1 Tax=Actinoplanes sp. CA-030573 TaxID=3239898 RepID=UPI003D8BD69E